MVEDYNSAPEETSQEPVETPKTDSVDYDSNSNNDLDNLPDDGSENLPDDMDENVSDNTNEDVSNLNMSDSSPKNDGSDSLPDYDVSDEEKEAVDKIETPTEFLKGDYLYVPNEQNVDTEEAWDNGKEILNDCVQNGYMVGTQNDSHSYAYSFKNMDENGNCPYICHDKINDSYSDGVCSTQDIGRQIKENGSFTYYEKNRVNVNKHVR